LSNNSRGSRQGPLAGTRRRAGCIAQQTALYAEVGRWDGSRPEKGALGRASR